MSTSKRNRPIAGAVGVPAPIAAARIRRPGPAMVVAIFALILAMGGSAVAVTRQSGDALIATRTLSGNRLRLDTVTGKEVRNLVWHNFALTNGWVNYNSGRAPGWAIDVQGVVHFRGAIMDTASTGGVFTYLPSAILPSVNVCLPTAMSNFTLGSIVLFVDGRAEAVAAGSTSDAEIFTSLDGLTYWLR